MRTWWKIGLLSAGLLLVACGGEKAPKPPKRIVAKPVLIHPLFFQEEVAAQLNFPFWFDDSLARGLESITWTTYSSFQLEPEQEQDPETYPKTTLVFRFNRDGRLVSLQRDSYSEGIVIYSKKYLFTPTSSSVFVEVSNQLLAGMGEQENNFGYRFLQQLPARKRVWQYDDQFSDTRYHYFPKKANWGSLSVDSIAHPSPQDWIICGTPARPEKRYQVRNTVTEHDVTHYSYLNDNFPRMISWSDYPFTQKRYFTYSPEGIFSGFTDSTFIDQSFVTSTVTTFELDKQNRPVQIVHEKGHASAEANYKTIERIQYTPFTSKQ